MRSCDTEVDMLTKTSANRTHEARASRGRENDSIFYEFNDLAVSLAEDTLTWFDLNGAQITRMWELAESPFDIAIHAQAVLGLVLDTIFERTPEPLPSESSGKMGEETSEEGNERAVAARESVVRVYPNPFSNSFNVDFTLESKAAVLTIEVFDLVGRTVKSQQFNDVEKGNVSIDLAECLGIYILRITADRKMAHQQKIVCLRQ